MRRSIVNEPPWSDYYAHLLNRVSPATAYVYALMASDVFGRHAERGVPFTEQSVQATIGELPITKRCGAGCAWREFAAWAQTKGVPVPTIPGARRAHGFTLPDLTPFAPPAHVRSALLALLALPGFSPEVLSRLVWARVNLNTLPPFVLTANAGNVLLTLDGALVPIPAAIASTLEAWAWSGVATDATHPVVPRAPGMQVHATVADLAALESMPEASEAPPAPVAPAVPVFVPSSISVAASLGVPVTPSFDLAQALKHAVLAPLSMPPGEDDGDGGPPELCVPKHS